MKNLQSYLAALSQTLANGLDASSYFSLTTSIKLPLTVKQQQSVRNKLSEFDDGWSELVNLHFQVLTALAQETNFTGTDENRPIVEAARLQNLAVQYVLFICLLFLSLSLRY